MGQLAVDLSRIPVERFIARFGPPVALAYFVMIGGTQWGEYSGFLRIANAVVATIFLVIYAARVTRRSDRIDGLMLLALLTFLLACLMSAFPRQSLDAALAALCWVALFYIARDVLAEGRARATTAATMMVLSAVTALFLANAEIGAAVRWIGLTNAQILPPLGMPVDVRPWGHEYDMAMLAVMLYPVWFLGHLGRLKIGFAVLVGIVLAVAVVLMGARNLWLATALATVLVAVPRLVQFFAKASRSARIGAIGALAAGALLLAVFSGPILDRALTSSTISQRTALWSAATEAWIHRPIAGYGPGAYPWIPATTDFFNLNSGHHRHPHNVVFQLLSEGGLIGLVAAGILLVAVGWPIVQRRRTIELFPLAVFLFGGIASNPTVYPYLIVVALVWAALALPRDAIDSQATSGAGHTVRRRLAFAGVALISVLTVPLLLGGVIYDGAVVAASKGETQRSRDALRASSMLDPGLAIYRRQLGIAELLDDDIDAAIGDLRRATALNPYDGVAWRALSIALVAADQPDAARAALDRALTRDRSDPANLLLLAQWQSEFADRDGLSDTAAEVVLAWPTVMFAPGWTDVLGDLLTPGEVIDLALARWHEGLPSPEPLVGQPLLLSILADRQDLTAAARLTGLSDRLVAANVAVLQCDAGAASALDLVPDDDRRTEVYWALKLQSASEQGDLDRTALDLYDLRTGSRPSSERAHEHLNPLRQINTSGALDPFGYGRLPIPWQEGEIVLPDPHAGLSRLMLDQPGALAALRPDGGPASCD
jgi:O-antigen ligase